MLKVKGKVDAGIDSVLQDRDGRGDLRRGVRRHGVEIGVLRESERRRATACAWFDELAPAQITCATQQTTSVLLNIRGSAGLQVQVLTENPPGHSCVSARSSSIKLEPRTCQLIQRGALPSTSKRSSISSSGTGNPAAEQKNHWEQQWKGRADKEASGAWGRGQGAKGGLSSKDQAHEAYDNIDVEALSSRLGSI